MVGRNFQPHNFAIQEQSLITLFGNQFEGFIERELLGEWNVEGD